MGQNPCHLPMGERPQPSSSRPDDVGSAFYRQDRDRVRVFETPAADPALTVDTASRSAFDYLARGEQRWRVVAIAAGWYVRIGLALSAGYQALRFMRGHIGTTALAYELDIATTAGAIVGGLGALLLLRRLPQVGYAAAVAGVAAAIAFTPTGWVIAACVPLGLVAIADLRAWSLGRAHAQAMQDLMTQSYAIRRNRTISDASPDLLEQD